MKISTCGRTTPNANANAIANLIVNLQLNRKDKHGCMVEEGGGRRGGVAGASGYKEALGKMSVTCDV